jgi:hypothetical protein
VETGGIGRRRFPWRDLLASALFTLTLFVFGWGVSIVGNAIARSNQGAYTFTLLVFLFVVAFLVWYAYPPGRRRWYHFAVLELCVLIPFGIVVPLVYLPWLIVSRRRRSAS